MESAVLDLQQLCPSTLGPFESHSAVLSSGGTLEWPMASDIASEAQSQVGFASPKPSEDEAEGLESLKPNDNISSKTLTIPLATPSSSVQSSQPAPVPAKAKRTPSIRKPKLPKREESAEAILDLGCLETLETYQKSLLANSSVSRTDLALLHHVFRHSRRLVVITGAGISVSAGIPDFRSASGLFALLKNEDKLKASGKQLFDASVVYNDLESTSAFQTTICDLHKLCASTKPTPFHECLNSVSKESRLLRLYTQNIDCLETSLPHLSTKTPLEAPWPQTVQLHGTINTMNCSKCHWISEFDPKVFDGCATVPECPECVEMESVRIIAGKRSQGIGRLRPKIVLYNEFNPDAEAIGKVTEADLSSRPDGLIVVGTTLKIPGVRRMVRELAQSVHAAKGATVWMNIDDPPQISKREFEGCFDLVVKGDCQIIPQVLNDFEQEKIEQEKQKLQERKEKAEAREASKELRQRQALERAERKAAGALNKVTKKRAPAKANRTVSEGSNISKKKPAQARRVKSVCVDAENIHHMPVLSKDPEVASTTSSASSASCSDYSTSDSSRDPSPHPEVYECSESSFSPSRIVISDPAVGQVKPIVAKRRTLGVLKKKSVNTTQVTKSGGVTKS